MEMKLTVAATETCRDDLDLDVVVVRGPRGTVLESKVFGSVEDDGVLRGESDGGHGGEIRGGLRMSRAERAMLYNTKSSREASHDREQYSITL
jgi:hypothetical protein